ncbi:MAG: hypothetical protein P857_340 [Candidatus Xenolissoclinum pacificiensis L6]|uniref:Uncharacterized protein n=1 Tax=Candidatus Xenolissoclinum pacificiensis L6 TaxID=1401685 RepID=W2UZY4_9RICK|nr:MAG: hypothetical protein P857_340 [Candidatus Xenolissoclinum pacificiensis L6]
MRIARIYQVDIYHVTQSVTTNQDLSWRVFIPSNCQQDRDFLMGWYSSVASKRLDRAFKSLQEAKDYVRELGMSCIVMTPKSRKISPKSYTDTLKNRL